MLAVVGTVPEQDFPLVAGKVTLRDRSICIQGRTAPVNRGTPALLAAAARAADALGQEGPFGFLIGDIGRGDGSRELYRYLVEHLRPDDFRTLAFHYLQPIVEWHDKILARIEGAAVRPLLIADAGYMYAAKMSGKSGAYDLFTPDIGELAFLADEIAPHPFYTRGFILHEQDRVPDMIAAIYARGNAPACMLVKGSRDYFVTRAGIQAVIDGSVTEAMEAIGGTGDTLTGIVAALSASGMPLQEASVVAAKANRLAGVHARATPATQVAEIIDCIPGALLESLEPS